MDVGRAIFFLSILAMVVSNQSVNVTSNLLNLANSWASTFGMELWVSGDHITKAAQVNESFKGASLQKRDDEKITEEITRSIKNMMEEKISAVRRIMDAAENAAMSFYKKDEKKDGKKDDKELELFDYYNAKCLVRINKTKDSEESDNVCVKTSLVADLSHNPHFWNLAVNTSFSAVHVPTNVYDRSPDVLKAIMWSENLNEIFKNNYQIDPSLSWQYFGSSTGFLRQFPAYQWKQEPVDLYDCRTRAWFIEAATSPKDLVILVDYSGSMTGIRKEIARHVVGNILDTLGNNDFVNIISFGEHAVEIEPCYKDRLVQANLANVRNFKEIMEKNMTTSQIANFSAALNKSFNLLQKYRGNDSNQFVGSQCNQAIMLITDGVPYNFKEIFEEFNWPNMPVRVFTYLVGREVADVREIKWMACANRGYYVHLSTLAEVREQVLQYIPVMARPLVLNKTNHPIIWTPVYADVTDPKMTDWLWQQKEHEEQKRRFKEFRKNKKSSNREDQDKRYITQLRVGNEDREGLHPYKLMTSVSMPVFDRRETETKIANLLGVAGTDVPISEMQKLMNPFKLGVNGYAFIVTNNGYVLYHPDLRPVFQGILKPNYNSIDMAEIELVNDGYGPREFNQALVDLREAVVDQNETGSAELSVKYHYDDMRRVGQLKRKYYYSPIENSPFTVVVSVPEDYGKYRVHAEVELHWVHVNQKGETILELFHGKNWRIHPDWIYCKYINDAYIPFNSSEEELVHFLSRSNQPVWKWKVKPKLSPDGHFSNSFAPKPDKLDKDSYFCDRDLFQSVVYDAEATKFFTEEHTKDPSRSKEAEFMKKFGITVSFVATRSGLTRWKYYDTDYENENKVFGDVYNKAIDEIWYKRAVEQYYINRLSFVYSVPFDVGFNSETLVTASRAIFHHDKQGNKAPAAVVGYQFKHSALSTLFFDTVSACPHAECSTTCASDDLDCYVLDNNAYIIVSENSKHTGRFFGEVHGLVMDMLVEEKIYDKIVVYDYQAVCFPNLNSDNSGNILSAPFQLMLWFGKWILAKLIWTMAEFGLVFSENLFTYVPITDEREPELKQKTRCDRPAGTTVEPDTSDRSSDVDPFPIINKTRPESCDQEIHLYLLQQKSENFNKEANGISRPYVVQPIQNTNLILVLVDALCLLNDTTYSNSPLTITYNETKKYENSEETEGTGKSVNTKTSVNCKKVHSEELRRRKRPKDCISSHEREETITLCGLGNRFSQTWYLLPTSFIALRAIAFLH